MKRMKKRCRGCAGPVAAGYFEALKMGLEIILVPIAWVVSWTGVYCVRHDIIDRHLRGAARDKSVSKIHLKTPLPYP